MKVRDKTKLKSEYKGRLTDASMTICPCMPCYNAHDCGNYVYDGPNSQKWRVRMECAIRWNNGCPTPEREPEHIYVSDRGTVCKRCGYRR